VWVGTDRDTNRTLKSVNLGGTAVDCDNARLATTAAPRPLAPVFSRRGRTPRSRAGRDDPGRAASRVNLGAVNLAGCFSSFLAERPSSPSVGAMLKDVVIAGFDVSSARISVAPHHVNAVLRARVEAGLGAAREVIEAPAPHAPIAARDCGDGGEKPPCEVRLPSRRVAQDSLTRVWPMASARRLTRTTLGGLDRWPTRGRDFRHPSCGAVVGLTQWQSCCSSTRARLYRARLARSARAAAGVGRHMTDRRRATLAEIFGARWRKQRASRP
jgi:hypothetical protein